MTRPPAACGTESGYARHYRRRETACADCLAAKRAAGRRRYRISRATQSLTAGVKIPAMTLARIYLQAPIDIQNELDRLVTPEVIDEFVRIHDHLDTEKTMP